VGCYIWYSDEGNGWAAAPPRPILAVPNVTTHSSTASVPTTNFVLFVLLTSWLCSFNAAIKGLKIFYTNMVTHKDPFFARGCTVKLNILSIIEQNFVPKFKKTDRLIAVEIL